VRRAADLPAESVEELRTRARKWVAPAILLAAVLFPAVQSDDFQLRVLTLAVLYAALAMSLVISLGYAGLFNMSQGTFFGLGAYTTAIVMTELEQSFLVASAAAVAVATLAGLLLGATSIRVRGDYWALVSMAFTVGTFEAITNSKGLTGGLDGYFGIPVASIGGFALDTPVRYYYTAVAVALITYVVVRRVTRSFAGRAMLASKADPAAAAMLGVDPTAFRLLSMAIGSGLAGLAGSALVVVSPFIHPSSFDLLPSFNITIFAVVGGSTSLVGAGAAAVFLTYIVEQYRSLSDYQLMIYGAALLAAIAVRSGIAASAVRTLAARLRRGRARV
jgi:branched-chain amino acid transport system permease protein